MSKIVILQGNEKTVINTAPIDKYMRILERSISEEGIHNRELAERTIDFLELAKEMNKSQLELLISNLIGKIGNLADILQSHYDDPEKYFKQIMQYKKLINHGKNISEEMGLDKICKSREYLKQKPYINK